MTWYANAARDPAVGPIAVYGRDVVRARGYSLLELAHVGLSAADAARLGLPVDAARASLVGCNVMQLRILLAA